MHPVWHHPHRAGPPAHQAVGGSRINHQDHSPHPRLESRIADGRLPGLQEEEVTKKWRYIDARCTWKPLARYLTWKWRRQGYRTAYVSVSPCKALVGALDYNHSGE
nr:MAG TPA: hypothetical protein [Caudoviricetes sp.]